MAPLTSDGEEQATTVVGKRGSRPAVAAVYILTVVDGVDRGLSVTLDPSTPSTVLIGQSPTCGVRLTDREVSRRHASLELSDTGLRLRDLGSTNGTWVDRVRIFDVELQGEEMVRIGTTTLRVDRREVAPSDTPLASSGFGRILGASASMMRLYPLCARLAASDLPVVIEGETGTGKEVLAEALHEQGGRASGPFEIFDCTAVPPSLVESELFGHERGAFTGAVGTRRGVWEQADGGTLLIDELGDLDLSLQPKLLRAIERSAVRRVGGDRWIRTNVRVLAATRRDLDREVQAGRFRDDLFHRIAVARIELPPLRSRRGDVSLLAKSFWAELGGDPRALDSAVLDRWEDYSWPGNVRELRNTVARLLALGELANSLAPAATEHSGSADSGPIPNDAIERLLDLPFIKARNRLLEQFGQRYVQHVLQMHGGDVARAALASGIGRRYFQKLRARAGR